MPQRNEVVAASLSGTLQLRHTVFFDILNITSCRSTTLRRKQTEVNYGRVKETGRRIYSTNVHVFIRISLFSFVREIAILLFSRMRRECFHLAHGTAVNSTFSCSSHYLQLVVESISRSLGVYFDFWSDSTTFKINWVVLQGVRKTLIT